MNENQLKAASRWRLLTAGLAVVCLILLVIVIILVVQLQSSKTKPIPQATCTPSQNQMPTMTTMTTMPTMTTVPTMPNTTTMTPSPTQPPESSIDTSEPTDPGIFNDLTTFELRDIKTYITSVPALGLENHSVFKSSKLQSIDLILPNKGDALSYLDGSGPKPTRKAIVVLARGDLNPPVIEEYRVTLYPDGPTLQFINNPNRRNPIEYSLKSFSGSLVYRLMGHIENEIKDILMESYGTSFSGCGRRCLGYVSMATPSAFIGKFVRMLWVKVYYNVEFTSLYPVDIAFYLNLDGTDSSLHSIDKIVYGGQYWNTLDQFKADYYSGSIKKSKFYFPNITHNSFSTVHKRGKPAKPYSDRRPPRVVEPDGPRYTVKHKHIEYMNWQFDVRMSVYNGPQIHDIRFSGERIAYEVGLQEIVVSYSGNSPVSRVSQLVDGVFLLGRRAKILAHGVDCPETATYLSSAQLGMRTKTTFCVFELTSGIPLQRHSSSTWYGGMVDSYLVVRTILIIGNYDYIFDFIFHQSGIMETRVISTGYILTGVYSEREREYGFEIEDRLLGTIHNHLFHFKVDLDILGTSNRYETLDIKTVNVSNSDWIDSDNTKQTQFKFDRVLKRSEREAAYKYNFDTPKEHLFYNNAQKNVFGENRAYKVELSGISKQLLPEGMLSESSISWARYQMAITKYKEEEYTSTSIYALFDSLNPVVNFTSFIDDENIVDEDLVLWISLGMYHIPHSEDLPLTQTPGKHLSFLLAPHNYFKEDPSMSSNDQIRKN